MKSYEERLKEVEKFVRSATGGYPELKIEINKNDEPDEESTSFEVKLSNLTNDDVVHTVINYNDDEFSILVGEDFGLCDELHLMRMLFLWSFLTPTA